MTNRSTGYSLVRFGLNTPNATRLAEFYEKAFCAAIMRSARQDADSFSQWPPRAHAGALRIVLQLGDSILELLQFDEPGAPYPHGSSPYDLRFQHLAIVVTDMPLAMQRLSRSPDWAPISTHGPQTLPPSAGGVTAFKFRDPDGHPLEFLQFAREKTPAHWSRLGGADLFPGIDHSAISIRNVDDSLQFYRSLGLAQSAQTLNEGIEQQQLDGIPDPHVDVIGMSSHTPAPHLELLHYRTQTTRAATSLACNDVAATRLVFSPGSENSEERGTLLKDPDGHFLEMLK